MDRLAVMVKLGLTEGLVLAAAAAILTIVLLVLDKAGKLKGPMLLVLLAVAAFLTLPLVLNLPWVANAEGQAKFSRTALMVCAVGLFYSLLAVWVSSPVAETKLEGKSDAKTDDDRLRQLTEANKQLVEEIRRLLDAQGKKAEPETLLAKYPLGYVIFDIDFQNSIFPYDRRLLDQFDFNWRTVRLSPFGLDKVAIRLPDISYSGGLTHGLEMVLVKQPGARARAVQLPGAVVNVEILAVREAGVVFVIGFERGPD